jgi:xanthine dehydrogenase small subunit
MTICIFVWRQRRYCFTLTRMTILRPATPNPVKTIRFIRRGEVVSVKNVPPSRTLLELLREDLGHTGSKEGCGEGDCGACTVVLGEAQGGALTYRAVNSCIRLAHSIDGMALWTVEDIAPTLPTSCGSLPPEGALRLRPGEAGSAAPAGEEGVPTLSASCGSLLPEGAECRGSEPAGAGLDDMKSGCVSQSCGLQGLRLLPGEAGSAAPAGEEGPSSFPASRRSPPSEEKGVEPPLHPAQQAMVNCHASQCGFCTPGFVMSLFGMYQNHVCKDEPITREMAQQELSGNLCRCTGYRPILEAAQSMAALPRVALDETVLLSKLELLAPVSIGLEADLTYQSPRTLAALLQARAAHPQAQLVAGCTDVGLWVTKQHRQFEQVLDVSQVEELRRIEQYPRHIAIGAAVTLHEAFAALAFERPQLQNFFNRFAGLPVRNSGTLGGNVANGSPIGDSMPLLIALGAHVVLMSVRGHRELPLERLYTGYRKNVMAADEVLAWIKVPKPGSPHPKPPPAGEGVRRLSPSPAAAPSPAGGRPGWGPAGCLQVYKISKRFDDDISALCLAINLQIANKRVVRASIGAGGVAATPVRAVKTEAALLGQPWSLQTVQQAMAVLRAEFSPISDMRASSAYRSQVLGNLLQRYWLESQGVQQINLASFVLDEIA